MQELEDRLALLPQDQLRRGSQWASLVQKAMEALFEATSGRSCYGEKQPEPLADLPETFEQAVEWLVVSDAEQTA